MRFKSVFRKGKALIRICRLIAKEDTLAEWLRRWPAKPLYFVRVGSNPTGVAFLIMGWDKTAFFMSFGIKFAKLRFRNEKYFKIFNL